MDDSPNDVPAEEATLTIDRRRIDRPKPPSTTPDQVAILRGMRRRAAWLRLQARICVVTLAMLLAGGGVIFLDARAIALSELALLPALQAAARHGTSRGAGAHRHRQRPSN